jgi:hypothetical protein
MTFLTLKRLLYIDLIFAIIGVAALWLLPYQQIGKGCKGIKTDACHLVRLFLTLFGGRNVLTIWVVYWILKSKDVQTRKMIAWGICLWCFYLPAVYVTIGWSQFLQGAPQIACALCLLFGCLYLYVLLYASEEKNIID